MKNKKTRTNNLELGQLAFGNPVGEYKVDSFVEALLCFLFAEIGRVYWNKNQETWEEGHDPELKEITIRPYYWGDDENEAKKPNFIFKEVEVRWYKHPFRSATVNVSKTERQWKQWFEDCLKIVRSQDTAHE